MKKLFLAILILISFGGNCCSAFKYISSGKVYVAKNFDWYSGQGYILKNGRQVNKCTYLKYKDNNTCWVSKYGSITFNQNGKEFPYGGINELGLVVEMLWLKETIYKENTRDATTISELEWIQYQLDNFSSVEEVISNSKRLDIDPITSTIHYFISDPSGKSAIVEFLNGELNISRSTEKIQAITNSSCANNEKVYKNNKSKFEDYYVPTKLHSSLRYCSLKNNLLKWPSENQFSFTEAFKLLGNISEDKGTYKTQWTIVYDLTDLVIKFMTYDNKIIRSIQLDKLDFESSTPTFYDLSSSSTIENVNSLMSKYSSAKNYKLIQDCIEPKLKFDYRQLNSHQLNPQSSSTDDIFSKGHMDVTVTIFTSEPSGVVRYFFANSEMDYRRQGPFGASIEINSNRTISKLYSLPVGNKYAYGAMHDVNGNGYLDRNFLRMPKEPFAFSGRKRFFFLPPKFKNALFDIADTITININ